jgi:penicillin G amidase
LTQTATAPDHTAPRRARRWPRRLAIGVLAAVLVLVLVAVALVTWSIRRPFPVTDGQLTLAVLDAPVDVLRDELGIPTIVASTERDLVRAQGFVHAQDRFWQMDVNRHIAAGRLAELFGPDQLDVDRFLRTLGFESVVREELAGLDPQAREALGDYADGVNAYLASRPHRALGLEYSVLGLQNRDYRPQPWEPIHTLLFLRLMAWDLGGNMTGEIERARLAHELGPERTADLFPPYPPWTPAIVDDDAAVEEAEAAAHDEVLASPGVQHDLAEVESALDALVAVRGHQPDGVGSNSWAVGGSRSATGAPLIANDPHLGIGMPAIWYANTLRCAEDAPDCDLHAGGFSFPGSPAVIIGHNERIAWAVTNLGPDVQDLYVERVNPDDPDQYEVDGEWVDMEVAEETLFAADGSSETLAVRRTRHGPVLSGVYGALDEAEETGALGDDQHVLALRWTALEPTRTVESFLGFNKAQDWEEFRAAAEHMHIAAQNLTYADVDGSIGYQATGRVPMRAGGDGTVPVPGWTDEFAWTGYVPFEELPWMLDPEGGVIATANNPVAGPDYPHFLSSDYDYGHRAHRIETLLAGAGDEVTVEAMSAMQGDEHDAGSEHVVPHLLDVDSDDERVQAIQELLRTWDGQAAADSASAAAYQATWRHLLAGTFHERMPERYHPNGRSRWLEVTARLLEDPDSWWWQPQGRDARLEQAMAEAHDELVERLGDDPAGWRWGDLHTATFRNATLGQSGIGLIERLFNRGPYSVGGGFSIVNATGWNAAEGYEVVWLPSLRLVMDLADLDGTRGIHTTGQAGHAYHRHYVDMAEPWQANELHHMPWSVDRAREEARDHLRLQPD